MPVFGRPGFLLAGAILALVPVLLHLIARRPPARAPLPTARFLTPDRRMRVRIERRPTDLPLMALRCLFILLLLAAFAEPRLEPRRSGTLDVIAYTGPGAATAQEIAGNAPAARLLALDRGEAADPDFGSALRQIRAAALESTADSVRAWLVAPVGWRQWPPGFAATRSAVWPGPVGIVPVEPARRSDGERTDPGGRAAIAGDGEAAAGLSAALEALGYTPDTSAAAGTGSPPSLLVTADGTPLDTAAQRRVLEAVSAGTRALITGASRLDTGPLAEFVPANLGRVPDTGLLHAGDRVISVVPAAFHAADGSFSATSASSPDGAPVGAVWWDGTAAAVSRVIGEGCVTFASIALGATERRLDPAFPDLLDGLFRGCETESAPDLPLDRGALAVLAGGRPADAPRPVAVADLDGAETGRGIARWLLLAALAVAVLESLLAGRTRRPGPGLAEPRTIPG